MKNQIDKLLEKLKKNAVDNDLEFLKCFIDLDERLKEIENMIIKLGSTRKSLIDFYDSLKRIENNTPTIDGEQINKTGGRPNDIKENNLECSPKRL